MFKRLLVLAVALALFVTVFFVYFHVVDAQIDKGFRQEREKFHVQGIPLTSDNPPALSAQAASSEPPAPASAPSTAVPVPPASADGSTNAPVNPNTLIGPVPPPSSDSSTAPATNAAPDNTPDNPAPSTAPATPTPAAPRALPVDPAAPVPAVPATFIYPGLSRLPMVLFASYNSPRIQTPTPTSATPTVSAPAPSIETSTNSPASSPTNSPTSSPTNAAASSTNNSAATSTNNTESASPTNAETAHAATQPEGETNHAAVTTNNVAASSIPSHGPVPIAASVIVLGYHQFTGPGVGSKNIYSMRQDVFEQEMKYLKDNGYHVVPLSDVVRFIKHEIGLPPNSVAVTIDDGYKSAIVWAAPVLKKYGFPWTFFVYPDFITVAEGKGAASWNDLLQLQTDGVDIECHSKSHPYLAKKGGKTPEQYDAWLTAETAGAKATLEKHLGKPVKYFAYPFGSYNQVVEAKVIAAGFDGIFTVANNPVHQTTKVSEIGRYIITAPVEKAFASYLRQGALGLADASPAPGATISDPRPVITAVLGYAGTLDPKTISADVRDFGEVRHDFDPKTSTVRLYLPRDLIDSVVVVNIRAKDAGQTMIASWRFNYAPAAPSAAHPPISNAKRPHNTPTASTEQPAPAAHEQAATAASTPASNSVSVATNASESAPATASTLTTNEAPMPSPTNSAPPISATPKK